MGRRKSKRKAPTKKSGIVPLDTMFTCPFCNHENSCEVKIEKDKNVGTITCSVCSEDFQTVTNYLTEPIDVYNAWIDACEEVNN